MKTVFYKIECLTNLHVGSGEVNYNVIDNEVEKDAITGLPTIHASGVKGALRDALSKTYSAEDIKYTAEDIKMIFGAPGQKNDAAGGSHKFLDAILISRPMRVWGDTTMASISVVTPDSVNSFLKKIKAFKANRFGIDTISKIDFGNNSFLHTCNDEISIENEPTAKMDAKAIAEFSCLKDVIGDQVAVTKKFDDYNLPVMARNCLQGTGNLWYEEVVPHGSILYFGVIYPDNSAELKFPDVVQFGGNASIGCGYTKITKLCEENGYE